MKETQMKISLIKSEHRTGKKAKTSYYLKLLHKYKTGSKQTWQVMKEIAGNQKTKSNLLPQEIKTDKTIIKIHNTLLKNLTNF